MLVELDRTSVMYYLIGKTTRSGGGSFARWPCLNASLDARVPFIESVTMVFMYLSIVLSVSRSMRRIRRRWIRK